jgi:hypothetical protein
MVVSRLGHRGWDHQSRKFKNESARNFFLIFFRKSPAAWERQHDANFAYFSVFTLLRFIFI